MSDAPTPPNGEVQPPLDPTTVQPVIPPPTAPVLPPHASTGPGVPPPVDPPHSAAQTYSVDNPWYRRGGVWASIAAGLIAIVLVAVVFFVVSGDDDEEAVTTDGAAAMQITVTRTTDGNEPFATRQTATVTGPTDTPNGFIWALPPNAIAPDPATAVTDGNGDVLFRWAPLEQLIDSEGWRSTLVISETLAPGITLGATDFNCLLERPEESTRGIPMTADISTAPVTEERTVTYSFPGHEFAPGDRMSCAVANGALVPSPTTVAESTTTVPETTTTVVETTTTVVETTTTVAPTTAAPTTAAPTTATPTTVVTTTAMTIIDGRTDLSIFRNLIDRSGLRTQLSDAAVMTTVLAPDNDAIAAFVATVGAPDLNDVDAARVFVLSHVLSGEILTSSDLAARADITLDEGPARDIDAATSPIRIGGAAVIDADDTATVSVIHTLDRALPDPAAP